MAWPTNPRPAKSLLTLRDQYNAKYPARNKASDGMLGDALHAQRVSDHNPNAQGVVCALDVTYDPAHGLDIAVEARRLVDSKDSRIKYVIANGRIWEPDKGWQPYNGADPHTGHMHVSVNTVNGDDPKPWKLTPERKTETMTAKEVDEMIASTYVAIAGRNPKDNEFVFHREQYAKQGDKWWLQMVQGFKGDDVAWKKYERNLIDAGKMLAENPDAKKLSEIKQILDRR